MKLTIVFPNLIFARKKKFYKMEFDDDELFNEPQAAEACPPPPAFGQPREAPLFKDGPIPFSVDAVGDVSVYVTPVPNRTGPEARDIVSMSHLGDADQFGRALRFESGAPTPMARLLACVVQFAKYLNDPDGAHDNVKKFITNMRSARRALGTVFPLEGNRVALGKLEEELRNSETTDIASLIQIDHSGLDSDDDGGTSSQDGDPMNMGSESEAEEDEDAELSKKEAAARRKAQAAARAAEKKRLAQKVTVPPPAVPEFYIESLLDVDGRKVVGVRLHIVGRSPTVSLDRMINTVVDAAVPPPDRIVADQETMPPCRDGSFGRSVIAASCRPIMPEADAESMRNMVDGWRDNPDLAPTAFFNVSSECQRMMPGVRGRIFLPQTEGWRYGVVNGDIQWPVPNAVARFDPTRFGPSQLLAMPCPAGVVAYARGGANAIEAALGRAAINSEIYKPQYVRKSRTIARSFAMDLFTRGDMPRPFVETRPYRDWAVTTGSLIYDHVMENGGAEQLATIEASTVERDRINVNAGMVTDVMEQAMDTLEERIANAQAQLENLYSQHDITAKLCNVSTARELVRECEKNGVEIGTEAPLGLNQTPLGAKQSRILEGVPRNMNELAAIVRENEGRMRMDAVYRWRKEACKRAIEDSRPKPEDGDGASIAQLYNALMRELTGGDGDGGQQQASEEGKAEKSCEPLATEMALKYGMRTFHPDIFDVMLGLARYEDVSYFGTLMAQLQNIANYVGRLSEHKSNLYFVVFFCAKSAFRYRLQLAWNVIIGGNYGTGKSHVLQENKIFLVPGTYMSPTRMTEAFFQTDTCLAYMFICPEEIDMRLMGKDKNGNDIPESDALKAMLTEGQQLGGRARQVEADKKKGQSSHFVSNTEPVLACAPICTAGNHYIGRSALGSRFHKFDQPSVPLRGNTKTGTAMPFDMAQVAIDDPRVALRVEAMRYLDLGVKYTHLMVGGRVLPPVTMTGARRLIDAVFSAREVKTGVRPPDTRVLTPLLEAVYSMAVTSAAATVLFSDAFPEHRAQDEFTFPLEALADISEKMVATSEMTFTALSMFDHAFTSHAERLLFEAIHAHLRTCTDDFVPGLAETLPVKPGLYAIAPLPVRDAANNNLQADKEVTSLHFPKVHSYPALRDIVKAFAEEKYGHCPIGDEQLLGGLRALRTTRVAAPRIAVVSDGYDKYRLQAMGEMRMPSAALSFEHVDGDDTQPRSLCVSMYYAMNSAPEGIEAFFRYALHKGNDPVKYASFSPFEIRTEDGESVETTRITNFKVVQPNAEAAAHVKGESESWCDEGAPPRKRSRKGRAMVANQRPEIKIYVLGPPTESATAAVVREATDVEGDETRSYDFVSYREHRAKHFITADTEAYLPENRRRWGPTFDEFARNCYLNERLGSSLVKYGVLEADRLLKQHTRNNRYFDNIRRAVNSVDAE